MIELRKVKKIYTRRGGSEVTALKNISLTVPTGQIHGIVGESGAGKSTLIRCLTALERPTEGQILVDGEDLAALPPARLREARRRIGMVFQGANLLDLRTAAKNIAYPLQLAHTPRETIETRVQELLNIVGLSDRGNSYPHQLSGGQRQRVGIARAMADGPSVLLCDEPTSALDSETTEQILQLIKSLRDKYGVTVLIITHEMGVVRKICDAVTLIDHGNIVSSGLVSDILKEPDTQLSRQIVPPPSFDSHHLTDQTVIDIAFTSRPGEPTGSQVLDLAATYGADIGAGVFETIGTIQVARLAITVANNRVDDILIRLAEAGVTAKVRAA